MQTLNIKSILKYLI